MVITFVNIGAHLSRAVSSIEIYKLTRSSRQAGVSVTRADAHSSLLNAVISIALVLLNDTNSFLGTSLQTSRKHDTMQWSEMKGPEDGLPSSSESDERVIISSRV